MAPDQPTRTSAVGASIPRGGRAWASWFAAAGVHSGGSIVGAVFESSHIALAAAIGGQGVALGLTPLMDDDLRAGRLVRLFETQLASPFSFWFVCRRDRLREGKIRAFRDWVVAEAGAPAAAPFQ